MQKGKEEAERKGRSECCEEENMRRKGKEGGTLFGREERKEAYGSKERIERKNKSWWRRTGERAHYYRKEKENGEELAWL